MSEVPLYTLARYNSSLRPNEVFLKLELKPGRVYRGALLIHNSASLGPEKLWISSSTPHENTLTPPPLYFDDVFQETICLM